MRYSRIQREFRVLTSKRSMCMKCMMRLQCIGTTLEARERSELDYLHPYFFPHPNSKVYWNRVKVFLESLPRGSLVAGLDPSSSLAFQTLLDIGCGDGKYFGVNPDIFSIGCDRSPVLLEVRYFLFVLYETS